MKTNRNMVLIDSTKEIQHYLKYMLEEFHRICVENDIYYVIFGGTMLGAVRHQGFIPWDDDVDVCVPRKDYEKLVVIMKSGKYQNFSFAAFGDDDYPYPFGKMLLNKTVLYEKLLTKKFRETKLYIDVFPVDGYPNEEEEHTHFYTITKNKKNTECMVRNIRTYSVWWKKPYALVRLFKKIVFLLLGKKYMNFLKKEDEERRRYIIGDSGFVSMQGAGWNEKGKLELETFFERKLYKFENLEVYGISNYDQHLKRLYGNYMSLPPIKKRKSNHNYDLFIDRNLMEELKNGQE